MKTLTGKAKEHFEAYYITLIREHRKDYDQFDDSRILRKFYRSLPCQQWGVYQDWTDSLDLELCVFEDIVDEVGLFFWCVADGICHGMEGHTNTRQEARNAALEKLNEIYNNKN